MTTIHVLCSALLKLRKECPLPPSKKVYRGFSGLLVPECFKKKDRRGSAQQSPNSQPPLPNHVSVRLPFRKT